MNAKARNYAVLAIVLVVGLAAAVSLIMGRSALPDSGPPPNAEQVTGVIVKVDSASLTDVHGFTLRTAANAQMVFVLDRLENGKDFPPGHLVEHQASSSPVLVWYRTENGVNYAIRLEDAEQTG